MAGPPLGAPTDFGKRGTLPQKEAGSPLEASLPGVAGPLGLGEVGVCRGLNCWLHYLHATLLDSEQRQEKTTPFDVNLMRSQVLYVCDGFETPAVQDHGEVVGHMHDVMTSRRVCLV